VPAPSSRRLAGDFKLVVFAGQVARRVAVRADFAEAVVDADPTRIVALAVGIALAR
jgi:hypothetical protein